MDRPELSDPPAAPASDRALDRIVRGFVEACTDWLVLGLLIAIAPALTLWPLLHRDEIAYLTENELSVEHRTEILAWLVVSVAVVAVGYVMAWRASTRKAPERSFGDTARAINRYAFIVLALPLLVTLTAPKIESAHPYVTLTFISAIAAMAVGFAYRLIERRGEPSEHGPSARQRLAPIVVLALLGIGYAIYFSWLAILDHHNLGTHFLDLAVYDNLVWHTSRGDFLGCSMCAGGTHTSTHFDPILVVVTPFYAFASRAETLLVFQSVWLASGVIPLYLLGRHSLGNPWYGVSLAATYAFYPALHGANMYDFHSLTLMVPSFLWVIYFVDRRSVLGYAIALCVLVCTREDMPLLACFIAVYALLRGWYRPGLVTLVLAPIWFLVIKKVIMYRDELLAVGHFVGRYEDMIPHANENLKGLVISVFTNPTFALQVLFREDKVFYYAAMLVPLLVLPFLARHKRVLCVYAIIFIGLANLKHHYSLHFQYSVVLLTPLLVCVPEALERVRSSKVPEALGLRARSLVVALAVALPIASLLTGVKFGALAPNDSFRAGWNPIDWDPDEDRRERYAKLLDVAASIPADASVCASSTITPHVSNRDDVRVWPRCKDADYVLLLESSLKPKDQRRLKSGLKSKRWAKVGESELGLQLLQRIGPPDDEKPTDARGRPLPHEDEEDDEDASLGGG